MLGDFIIHERKAGDTFVKTNVMKKISTLIMLPVSIICILLFVIATQLTSGVSRSENTITGDRPTSQTERAVSVSAWRISDEY